MEIQELRTRIRQWKARTQGVEYPEDEYTEPGEDFGDAVDVESEVDLNDDVGAYVEQERVVDATESLELDAETAVSDPSSPPSDEMVQIQEASFTPEVPVEATEQEYASSQPAEQTPTPEQAYADPDPSYAPEQESAQPQAEAQPQAAPQQVQLTAEQMTAVQAYGEQLTQQGYSAEQIQAAQQQYIQQILAHQAAQQGGQGQPQ